MADARFKVTITANDKEATDALKNVQKELDKTKESATAVGVGMTALGAAITGVSALIVKSYMDMGDEEESDMDMDDEEEAEEEDEMSEEMVREYKEKAPAPVTSEQGDGASGPVAGKNDMGGSAKNIAQGGDEKGGAAPKVQTQTDAADPKGATMKKA